MTRIPVNPELLTWARKRAGLDTLALVGRFPKLSEWETGELQPTLRQLEDFARDPEHDPSALGEAQAVLKDLLALIRHEDAAHYDAMVELVDPPVEEEVS